MLITYPVKYRMRTEAHTQIGMADLVKWACHFVLVSISFGLCD